MIFKEEKDQLIKVIDVNRKTKVPYIISTLLNIINRWNNVRVYIFDINKKSEGNKNEK